MDIITNSFLFGSSIALYKVVLEVALIPGRIVKEAIFEAAFLKMSVIFGHS